MPRPVTVLVLPNPYASLDHEGRPAGHCPRERVGITFGHQGFVCCAPLATTPVPLEDGHHGTPDQDTVWHFSKEPRRFPDPKHYYKQRLQDGDIIAADEATAAYANEPERPVKFLPYAKALAAAKAAAAVKWKAVTGEDLPDVDPFERPVPGVMPWMTPEEKAAARKAAGVEDAVAPTPAPAPAAPSKESK